MAMRLFAALAIPGDISEGLTRIMRGVPGAAWRPQENLHLTLRFFGEIPENVARDLDTALDEGASGFAPFEFALKGAGWFGKDDPHALWAGARECQALRALAADCERAARRVGLAGEPRKYQPHVTLAYLRGAPLERVVAFTQRHALLESRAWRVDRFSLYSSWLRKGEASLYREEASYPLLG